MTAEWYPRECWYCTREAALACEDQICRGRGYGQEHNDGCPAAMSRLIKDCSCVRDA